MRRKANWVRNAFIRWVCAAALFTAAAGPASAIIISLDGANGQGVLPGSQISLTVTLDTEDTKFITLLSIGVLFDDTRLSYVQNLSSTTSYILYGGKGGGGYMKASSTCGGYPQLSPPGCSLRVNTSNQVNIDYVSTDLQGGTKNTGAIQLVTLVFDVLSKPGNAAISLSQTSPGNVVGQPGGQTATATLMGNGHISVVPEPTTALLLGLGTAGLCVGGRRRTT